MKKEIEQVEQKETLEKTSEGFKLTINNYGGNKGQILIQNFNKEELKTQYNVMKETHHKNAETIKSIDKSKKLFSGEERTKMEDFMKLANNLQKYNAFIQSEAQAEDLLKQQESIRRGLKDIEREIPELKRNK